MHNITPGPGYAFQWGTAGPILDAHKNGAPVTLGDALTACEGVAHATIWRPDGTVLMENAGSYVARRIHLDRGKADRTARRVKAAHAAYVAHLAIPA